MTNAHWEFGASATLVGERTGLELALNPGLWLCCLGIKIHTDSGKEMETPGILCGCRLHPAVEEQAGDSVELGQTQEPQPHSCQPLVRASLTESTTHPQSLRPLSAVAKHTHGNVVKD